MGKGSSLDLENVIRHLPGRDASLKSLLEKKNAASSYDAHRIFPQLTAVHDYDLR